MKEIIYTISLTIFIGCIFTPNSTIDYPPIELKYKTSFYKNDHNNIQFVRIVEDSSVLRKISGNIMHDAMYNIKQEIIVDSVITNESVLTLKKDLTKNGFRTKFDDKRKVLFLQIRPEVKGTFGLLNFRHKTETELGDLLQKKEIGEYIAGDLGPGGANILFELDDWDKSFDLILSYLNSKDLLTKSLIARRLYTADDDWTYEIVYPINYNGIFNQM